MVVVEVPGQDSAQVGLVEHDHVVHALATNRADEAFDVGILPGRSGRGDHLCDAEALHLATEKLAVDSISVADQESRRRVRWEGLHDLSRRPFPTRAGGDVEMQDAPSIMGVSVRWSAVG